MAFRSEECAQDAGQPTVGACAGCERHGCTKCLTEVGGGWLCAGCAEGRRGQLHLPVFAHFTPATWGRSARMYFRTPSPLRWLHARIAELPAFGLLVVHSLAVGALSTFLASAARDDLELRQVASYAAVGAAAWMVACISVARLVARGRVVPRRRGDAGGVRAADAVSVVVGHRDPQLRGSRRLVAGLLALVASAIAAGRAEPAL